MFIPPHLQWLQARQGPPPDSQDSKQNGQSQGNNGAGNGGGSDHTRTTIGIIVSFFLGCHMVMGWMRWMLTSVVCRCPRLPRHLPRRRLLYPPYPSSDELSAQVAPREIPQRQMESMECWALVWPGAKSIVAQSGGGYYIPQSESERRRWVGDGYGKQWSPS